MSGLLLLLASCSRTEPAQQEYARAWAAYVAGDLDTAGREASSYTTRAQNKPDSYWVLSLKLLDAEVLDAQSKWNQARDLLVAPLLTAPELGQLEVRRLIDLATVQIRSNSETAKIPGILAQASVAVREPELRVRLYVVEGLAALNARQWQAAQQSFSAAADLAARERFPYWQAYSLNNLSYALKKLGRYEESIEVGQSALAAAEKLGAHRVAGLAHGNLGSAYAILGDFDNAFEHQRQAIAIFEAIGAQANLMTALGELGLAYDGDDDLPNAISNYRKAYDIALAIGSQDAARRHAGNLATTLIKARQWDQAAEWNQRASDLARSLDARAAFPFLERNRARIAQGRGDFKTAARIGQDLLRSPDTPPTIRWAASALLGDLAADAKRFPEADRCFEQALRIIESTRSDLLDPNYRMTLLSQLMPFYRAYVDVLWRQKDDALALRVVESSRARVLAERLEQDVAAAQPRGLAEFERVARDAHVNILSFWLAPERSFAWLITGGGVERFELPGSAAIEKLVTNYRDTVEHSVRDPLTTSAAGRELWRLLLAPVAPHIRKGERLIVIPDGALHRLNLETLVAPAPHPHYWIEDVEMAVSPSIEILASPPQPGAGKSVSLLLIGAPDYAGSRYRPLANAEREIREIQADFPGRAQQAYLGAQASPAVYSQSDPQRFSLIHFAAHAEANAQRPLESAVILSHGKLYARDVVGIPIHAALVTISACSSAGTRTYAGEGLVGFAWAFLRAGARAVAAGLWDVSDSSTEQLMNAFYRQMAAGADPVTAMRHAKLELLGSARFARPYYWAPFQIYVSSLGR
ncbi:MAG: CHAT domain-containing tetratricopeptide repeat protein [Bryobacteraceae bacterium]|jgi:CHAT domain-containing protein